MDKKPVIYL